MDTITQVTLLHPSGLPAFRESGDITEVYNTEQTIATPIDAADILLQQMGLETLDRLQVKVADRRNVIISGIVAPQNFAPVEDPTTTNNPYGEI